MSIKFFTGLSVNTIKDVKPDYSDLVVGIKTEIVTSQDKVDVKSAIVDLKDGLLHQHKRSRESQPAAFNTFFNNFNLQAEPFYNFFVDDEEYNVTQNVREKTLSEIPRYIKLSWNVAPDIKVYQVDAPNKKVKTPKKTSPKSFFSSGLIFTPKLSEEFTTIKNSVANGYLSPINVSTIVETLEVGSSAETTKNVVDENRFLLSEFTKGLSINQLQSNVDAVKKASVADSSDITQDRFSYFRDNGVLQIDSTHSSSPVMSFSINTVKKRDQKSLFVDFVKKSEVTKTKSNFTNVNFSDPSIVGLVSEEKVGLISKPEHSENTMALAQFLPNLKTITSVFDQLKTNKKTPSFPSSKESVGVEYIGYVLQKFRQDENGVFVLVREIDFPDRTVDSYIDTEVVYGGIYRYRIKAIVRWTRPSNISIDGLIVSDAFGNDFSVTKPTAPNRSTYFETEWCEGWAYASVLDNVNPLCPDEFNIRPQSVKKRVCITWKIPENSQKDLAGFILYRKTIKNDIEVSEWKDISGILPPINTLFFDTSVDYYEDERLEYLYAAQSISKHGEKSFLSEQLKCKIYKNGFDEEIIFVSESGVMLENHGMFSVKPPKIELNENISKDIICFSGRNGISDFLMESSTYVAEIQSLDTGERKSVKIDINYNNVNNIVKETSSVSQVSSVKKLPEIPKGFIR